jgi:hypothetical protein
MQFANHRIGSALLRRESYQAGWNDFRIVAELAKSFGFIGLTIVAELAKSFGFMA